MNEKVSDIRGRYVKQFRAGFNDYVTIRERNPFDQLKDYKRWMWRLGMLCEVWLIVEANCKEKI